MAPSGRRGLCDHVIVRPVPAREILPQRLQHITAVHQGHQDWSIHRPSAITAQSLRAVVALPRYQYR
jgi:hypothetical protein